MKLYITRHGETMRNAEQRILGRTDDPLSEKGKQQAAELAEKMKDIDIDLIFTSPLSRAKETAQTIADVKGMSLIVDDRLKQILAILKADQEILKHIRLPKEIILNVIQMANLILILLTGYTIFCLC